jgi:hypothetical protein
MALQFSVTARNGMLDSIETSVGVSAKLYLRTGAPPATCATADSGSALAHYDLASDWAAAAGSGAKAFSSLPLADASADNTGTLGHFRLYATDGTTCHMQGTITATGGGGDMTVDNTSVTSGQAVNITAFTITAPGA